MEQETLIYIDDKEKYDASAAANFFTNKEVKSRVYINSVGAELGIKYLNTENIDTSDLKNLHSIKKIIEEFDIADIILKGIHIDVRVVFDENAIFVPKSHFEYGLVPDIYLVFKMEKDYSHVAFLGFFEPKMINKNNANKDYYFIEKEKLSPALDLIKYIEANSSKQDVNLSAEDMEKCENLIISMSDNDISDSNKKYLLEQLTKSSELRDKFIEFENFEALSYKAMTDPSIDKHSIAQDVTPVDEFEVFDGSSDLTEIAQEEVENSDNDSIDLLGLDTAAEAAATATGIAGIAGGIAAEAIDDIVETTSANAQELIENASDAAGDLIDLASDSAENIINDLDDNAELHETIDLPADNEIIEDNFEISEPQDNVLEDAVTLNDIDIDSSIIEEDNITTPEDAISVDNIDVTNNIEEVIAEPAEKIDLPNENELSESNIDISELQDNILDDAVALNDIDVIAEENTQQAASDDSIALENIDIPDFPDENEDDNIQLDLDDENSYKDTFPEEEPDPRLEESISLDDIDDSNIGGAKSSEFDLDMDEEAEDLILDSDDDNNDTFGKNLLENLSEKSTDDILIEGIDNISEDNIETIATEDLLTQVEDIIDKAATSENPSESIQPDTESDLLLENISLIDNDVENAEAKLDDILPEETAEDNTTAVKAENLSDEADNLFLDSEILEDTTSAENLENVANAEISELTEDIIPENNIYENSEAAAEILEEAKPAAENEPQDYIEDLLDTENTTPTEETKAEGDDLNVLYTEAEEPTQNISQSFDDIEELEDIEPDTVVSETQITEQQKQQTGTKSLIIAAVIVGLIAAATAFYFIKPKDNNAADFEPLPNSSSSALTDNKQANDTDRPAKKSSEKAGKKPDKTTENVLETNAPDVKQTKVTNKKPVVKELKNNPPQRPITSTAYMSVSKLVWDVPDSVSYSTRMQNYLRTAGRSIKLTLSTDLLLATEYAYANSVKAGITLGKGGSVQSVKIIAGSGSSQIDNIVLQSVKETLNAIKPPSEDIKGNELNLNLIIYF